MTAQEKTEHIKEAAMTEAREQANSLIQEHTDALQNLLDQHEEEAKQQKQSRIEAEMTSANHTLSAVKSKAQLQQKQAWGKLLGDLTEQLFLEVQEQLADYMKTDDYKEKLAQYIQNAADYAGGVPMTIYINPTDEDKKADLEAQTGMELTVSKDDFVGGIRAVIREKNILIDHAYKGAIEREKRDFLSKGGAYIG